jgi:hypothetical protein
VNAWLCELGQSLSQYAYADLSRAHSSRGRLQSSETGLTHVLTRIIWTVAERNHRAKRVAVAETSSSEEQRTGADMELWFTDGSIGLGWRIQAKRLYAPSGRAAPPRFARLEHRVGQRMQATVLTGSTDTDKRSGIPIAAMYWLYAFDPTRVACSGLSTCRCGASSARSGILVADAHRVRGRVLRRRQLVEPFSFHRWVHEGFALCDILCDAAAASDPRSALSAVAASTAALGAECDPSDALPEYVLALLDGQATDVPDQVDGEVDLVAESPNARVTAVIDLRE